MAGVRPGQAPTTASQDPELFACRGSCTCVPERFETSQGLLGCPVVASEIGRFDALLDEHHWLGRGLVGETLRHVAVIDDEWIGLVGYGSPALTCSARDRWIGWSPAVRYRRLRFVANNQRFCILPAGRYPNVASAVLGASLRRLAADWEVAWGHRVVLVETFTDPQIHPGTCYQATNFKVIGETSGWRRNKGSFVHHGRIKHVWVHPLHRVAASILSSTFDHPIIAANPRRSPVIDCNTLDFDSDIGLLARLSELPEHRMARGIRHSTASVIAVAVVAVLSGARSFTAIGEVAGELPQEVPGSGRSSIRSASAMSPHRSRPSGVTSRRSTPMHSTESSARGSKASRATETRTTGWSASRWTARRCVVHDRTMTSGPSSSPGCCMRPVRSSHRPRSTERPTRSKRCGRCSTDGSPWPAPWSPLTRCTHNGTTRTSSSTNEVVTTCLG